VETFAWRYAVGAHHLEFLRLGDVGETRGLANVGWATAIDGRYAVCLADGHSGDWTDEPAARFLSRYGPSVIARHTLGLPVNNSEAPDLAAEPAAASPRIDSTGGRRG
jgi:hypothetical protein